jgi:hypothetical protein
MRSPFLIGSLCMANIRMLNIEISFSCNGEHHFTFNIMSTLNCLLLSHKCMSVTIPLFSQMRWTTFSDHTKLCSGNGLVAAATWMSYTGTGNTILLPVVSTEWKVSSYLIVADYHFIRLSKNIYISFSFWYDGRGSESECFHACTVTSHVELVAVKQQFVCRKSDCLYTSAVNRHVEVKGRVG